MSEDYVQRHTPNAFGRDIAVGDIHGCFSALQRALDSIGFDRTKDRLFAVGDLVDRGPESAEVLQWLDQPWFHAICGNHDFMTWRRALGNPYAEVDHRMHGGNWLDACTPEQQQEIGSRLSALPLAMEIETPKGPVGIVHADYPYDDWEAMRSGDLSERDIDCCLWSWDRYAANYTTPVKGLRALIHGHTTIKKPLVLGNVFFIDTGGWTPQGYFTLLDLHTLKPAGKPASQGRVRPTRMK